MIVTVDPQEAPAIADFIERTIALSVDATAVEKDAFVRNVRSNLQGWQDKPVGVLHLKYVAAIDGCRGRSPRQCLRLNGRATPSASTSVWASPWPPMRRRLMLVCSTNFACELAMTVQLDHTIVPSHTRDASAQRLAALLGVPHGPARAGPFYAVYVNDGLTLDFIQSDEDFPIYHFAFRVSDAAFDAILGRIEAAGIPYRSDVAGRFNNQINRHYGGSMVYWNEPDGHQWEILTVSYARR